VNAMELNQPELDDDMPAVCNVLVYRYGLQRGELLCPARAFHWRRRPYDKLTRALRADIDEAAWSTLYKTTSQAFPAPKTGKIAVKVINHHGDEVLKVFRT
jgi:hypothetical protein